METKKTLLVIAAGIVLIGSVAEAQTQVQPTRPSKPQVQTALPDKPQIQPPRPGRPQIQPPRPVSPVIVKPRPPRPEIQPPRPPRPQPPRPIRPRPPITINPGWGHHNPGWAYGRAVLFSGSYYSGHFMTVRHNIADLRQFGFNDRADSLHARGRWQICSETHYRGRCATVRGSDPYLGRLTGRVSSIRYIGR